MKRISIISFFAILLFVACKSSKSTSSTALDKSITSVETWIIANEKVKCSETSEDLCYQIKKGSNINYEMLNAEINGFTYEPGYKYQLEVKVSHSKAGMQYNLVKELYKIPVK